MTISKPWLIAAAAAVVAVAAATAEAQPVSSGIKLDHFGYRPADAKVSISTADPGAVVQVRDAATLAVVFTAPTNGGSIVAKGVDGTGSFDNVWWVDFSPFATVGSYHLFSPTLGGKSYDFVDRGDAHLPVFRAALKGYYRQRCNTPKLAAHAGAWPDPAACHIGDLTITAEVGHTNQGVRDLTGGWHDAGDYASGAGSDGSGVLEPGETVMAAPAWRNHRFVASAITGSGGGNYCPSAPVTREQMSVFLSLPFGLTLYAP